MTPEDQKVLQAILNNSNLDYSLDDYKLNLPDAADESGAEGLWDLAGAIAADIIPFKHESEWAYDKAVTNLQSLLYNLFRKFVTDEREENE